MTIIRRPTKKIRVGNMFIGGGAPVSVQSMVKADAHDPQACIEQILRLEEVGCDIVRMGFLDMESVKNIGIIKKKIHIPLVADIHFDYTFALEALRQGVDKLRLNPGNIGGPDKVRAVADEAKKRGVPIRIGVNAGSLQREILAKYGHPTPEALVESAAEHIKLLEAVDFDQIVVSLKTSRVETMVAAYRLFSERFDYPLHLGVTEAGLELSSTVKSAMGIGSLLLEGIGDTIRVSMTGDNTQEILVGREILKHLGLRREPILISCPTCSRTNWDLIPTARRVQAYIDQLGAPLTVAVMGCAVNGPGEAREADIGIAGGNHAGIIFIKGQVVATVPEERLYDELVARINEMVRRKGESRE
ncbi:flavodoxin-dependent (E)-4-hydroxy-3-methylbut-2-enyl-diphosphate synthase [bacterium]|nr:flavodoxin-dependent (E)-4-hydroxy-3-methylbut-2-enyl-diphosphate synthase [bacterium]